MYKLFFRLVFKRMDPEQAHHLAFRWIRLAVRIPVLRTFVAAALAPRYEELRTEAFGLRMHGPFGLAAGFDKNAVAIDGMSMLGFDHVEIGTVTGEPQPGNPKKRLFRLVPDRALINRMGFNNEGSAAVAARLEAREAVFRTVVGVNIGKTKVVPEEEAVGDYVKSTERLARHADYLVVNVSSPNTPGLRGLQNRDELTRLLDVLTGARAKKPAAIPLLLKIAPDLDSHALDEIADVVRASGIEGLIVSNTTVARPALKSPHAGEAGGLSGKPLFLPSTQILAQMHQRLGSAVTLVGVGGIASGQDAYAKIRAGASLVQLYSALVFEGPGLVARIKRELLQCLERDGFANVTAAVGTGAA